MAHHETAIADDRRIAFAAEALSIIHSRDGREQRRKGFDKLYRRLGVQAIAPVLIDELEPRTGGWTLPWQIDHLEMESTSLWQKLRPARHMSTVAIPKALELGERQRGTQSLFVYRNRGGDFRAIELVNKSAVEAGAKIISRGSIDRESVEGLYVPRVVDFPLYGNWHDDQMGLTIPVFKPKD